MLHTRDPYIAAAAQDPSTNDPGSIASGASVEEQEVQLHTSHNIMSNSLPLHDGVLRTTQIDPIEQEEFTRKGKEVVSRIFRQKDWTFLHEKNGGKVQVCEHRPKESLRYRIRSVGSIQASIDTLREIMTPSLTKDARILNRALISDRFLDSAVMAYHVNKNKNQQESVALKWMALKSKSKIVYDVDLSFVEYAEVTTAQMMGFGLATQRALAVVSWSIETPICRSFLSSHKLERVAIQDCGFLFVETNEPHLVDVQFVCSITQPDKVYSRRKANRSILLHWAESIARLEDTIRNIRITQFMQSRPEILWVEDTLRKCCQLCYKTFSQLKRKHHCRMCGDLFCKPCLVNYKIDLPPIGSTMLRICKACIDRGRPSHGETTRMGNSWEDKRYERDDALAIRSKGDIPDVAGIAWLQNMAKQHPDQLPVIQFLLQGLGLNSAPTASASTTAATPDSSALKNEEIYDRLCELAIQALRCKYAILHLIGDDCCRFHTRNQIAKEDVPDDLSICNLPIEAGEPIVVLDTLRNAVCASNPIVYGKLKVRFLAGAPIYSVDGRCAGSVCVLDDQPREEVVDNDLIIMRRLASLATVSLQEREVAKERKLEKQVQVSPLLNHSIFTTNGLVEPIDSWKERTGTGTVNSAAAHDHAILKIAELLRKTDETSKQLEQQRQGTSIPHVPQV